MRRSAGFYQATTEEAGTKQTSYCSPSEEKDNSRIKHGNAPVRMYEARVNSVRAWIRLPRREACTGAQAVTSQTKSGDGTTAAWLLTAAAG